MYIFQSLSIDSDITCQETHTNILFTRSWIVLLHFRARSLKTWEDQQTESHKKEKNAPQNHSKFCPRNTAGERCGEEKKTSISLVIAL